MTKLEMKGMLIVLKSDWGYFVCADACVRRALGSWGVEVRRGQMPYTAEDHA